jgi:SAM-dependent methyltransferase
VLLGLAGRVVAVDTDIRALSVQERRLQALFLSGRVQALQGDFTAALPLPLLDGALMANSLHFHADHCRVLSHVAEWIRPGGMLVVVEYDIRRGNPWVPHPLPFSLLCERAGCAGLGAPRLLLTRPSRYHGRAYSAAIEVPQRRRRF